MKLQGKTAIITGAAKGIGAAAAQARLHGNTLFQADMQAVAGDAGLFKKQPGRPKAEICFIAGQATAIAGHGDVPACAALQSDFVI